VARQAFAEKNCKKTKEGLDQIRALAKSSPGKPINRTFWGLTKELSIIAGAKMKVKYGTYKTGGKGCEKGLNVGGIVTHRGHRVLRVIIRRRTGLKINQGTHSDFCFVWGWIGRQGEGVQTG